MDSFERSLRALVLARLRDSGEAPTHGELAAALGVPEGSIRGALHALAAEHRLALVPGTDRVWMAHPFSALPSDFLVTIRDRRWYANCVWDGLSILALLGDGTLETHSPATGEPIKLTTSMGAVMGEALVHFLVPARRFWDDIGFT
jgi:hypothetical protein